MPAAACLPLSIYSHLQFFAGPHHKPVNHPARLTRA
jgi:hypothetical protein